MCPVFVVGRRGKRAWLVVRGREAAFLGTCWTTETTSLTSLTPTSGQRRTEVRAGGDSPAAVERWGCGRGSLRVSLQVCINWRPRPTSLSRCSCAGRRASRTGWPRRSTTGHSESPLTTSSRSQHTLSSITEPLPVSLISHCCPSPWTAIVQHSLYLLYLQV